MGRGAIRSALAAPVAHIARNWSLRARLLVGLVLVAAIGLGVASIVVYNEVEPYLLNQTDQQLQNAIAPMERASNGVPYAPGVPAGTFGLLLDSSGHIDSITCVEVNSVRCPKDRPRLPAGLLSDLAASTTGQLKESVGAYGSGASGYRILVEPILGNSAYVVAIPLNGVAATLGRLVWIELAVSLGVLLVLVGLGYVVVRIGMRPLTSIADTASAIAAGDLSRRVEREEQHTEIGRLSASLNAMLSQIENAFLAQKDSAAQLRQFLADASHELRTPVTSIRGYAELFRRGASNRPEDLARAMRRIEDEAARMGLLVDDLLLLARLDQGRPLEQVPVNLGVIASDAAADASLSRPESPIEVDAESDVVVEGDEQRLRQVATNLIQNAVQHTPDGTPITVVVRKQGSLGVLIVADEGPGIAPEHAEHVFERFYRADPSRARASGGSGLGLSIVASIAEAHHGRARLETAVGRGARFIVELPLALVKPSEVMPVTTSSRAVLVAGADDEESVPQVS
jgi:two-component system OmpR family sensor kinase